MKAIFDTRAGSEYDDDIVERYHFPNRYLDEAKKAVGDWIIYREPRRGGGRQAYVALALLQRIDPDPARPDHSYARLSSFQLFDHVVPLKHAGGFYERRLDSVPATRRGASLQGKSIRVISDAEFASIVVAGLEETFAPENAVRLQLDPENVDKDTLSLLTAPLEEKERRIATILVNRKIREASFRRRVLAAYDNTCAITGLRLINGGGKAEVQAAHIWSVADGSPDVERNGIALSATVHWLFDRHLISLTDNHGLLVSHNRVPTDLQALFKKQLERIRLPKDERLWPHVPYIQKHRAIYMAK